MPLLVIAYPELKRDDYQRIQVFRQQHDALYYPMVEPHFTFVFPLPAVWQADPLIMEIEQQLSGTPSISFCLRCATLNKDAFKDYYHTFLVPDEGYSHVVKLHDKLYAHKLFPQRALHVDYIPHISVGNSPDPMKCLEMVAHWNQTDLAIGGHITKLDIVLYEANQVTTIKELFLTR